ARTRTARLPRARTARPLRRRSPTECQAWRPGRMLVPQEPQWDVEAVVVPIPCEEAGTGREHAPDERDRRRLEHARSRHTAPSLSDRRSYRKNRATGARLEHASSPRVVDATAST